MTTGGFLQGSATTPVADGGPVGMARTPVLLAVAGSAVVWLRLPASIRYSGVFITYAIGAVVGGAVSPLVSAWLVQVTGTSVAVGLWL